MESASYAPTWSVAGRTLERLAPLAPPRVPTPTARGAAAPSCRSGPKRQAVTVHPRRHLTQRWYGCAQPPLASVGAKKPRQKPRPHRRPHRDTHDHRAAHSRPVGG
eukprot:scaffold129638_cov48-Phaeocystis_antarctica.AAC.1